MVDIESIQEEVINNLDNRKEIYAILFKLSLTLIKESDIIISKEFINKISNHFKLIEEDLNPYQIIFVSEVILNLILHYSDVEDNEINDLKEYYEKNFSDNILKDEILKTKKISNVEDLISHIIIYFFNNFESFLKLKQDWDKLDLYLQNFEINEATQKTLENLLEQNNNIAEYFKEIELKSNVISDSKILKEIYNYLEFKTIKKVKKEKIKYEGDKERANNDSGRDADYTGNEYSEKNSTNKYIDNNLPSDIIEQIPYIINNFTIMLVFNSEEDKKLVNCYVKDKEDKYKYIDYEIKYGWKEKNTNVKNFVKCLEFVNNAVKYIKEMEKELKFKTKIYLEFTIINKKQNQETKAEMDKRKIRLDDDLYNIKCVSYFIDDEKDKENKEEYKDENVLVYGLDGQVPGFIYLINELYNDDYIYKMINIH